MTVRPPECFSFDRSTGEWDHILPGYGDDAPDGFEREKLCLETDPCAEPRTEGIFGPDMFRGLLRVRSPSILDVLKIPRRGRSVFRHLRPTWVDQQQKRLPTPPRKDYRDASDPWVEAMHKSLQKTPHLPLGSAYYHAATRLGEPPGKGRPESKRARIIRLYKARYGKRQRP